MFTPSKILRVFAKAEHIAFIGARVTDPFSLPLPDVNREGLLPSYPGYAYDAGHRDLASLFV